MTDNEVIPAASERFGRAVGWSFVMNGVRLLATLGTTFILAGLLGPRLFGTVSLALIYISLLQLLMQQGLIPAIIQRPGLTRRHLDSAFWMTITASVLLTIVSIVSSGWWANVNDAPDAEQVIWALSTLLIIKGLVVVQEALLRRQMHFRDLAVRTTVASVSGAVVGLTWAIIEPSIWALVAQQVTTELMGCVVLWSVSGWRPRLRFWPDEARQLVGFAGKASLSSFGVFINNRVDALLVGVFFGPAAVGLYRLAARVVESAIEVTVQPIQHVSLPEFSRHQGDPDRQRSRFITLVATSTAIGAPVMATVFASADSLMATVGDEWKAAAPALQLLCVVGLVRAMTMLNGAAIQAAGRPGAQAMLTWVAAGLSAAAFVAAGLALTDRSIDAQVLGMAASRAVLYAFVLLPVGQVWLITRVIGATGTQMIRRLGPSVAVCTVAAVAGTAASELFTGINTPSAIVLVTVSAATFGTSAAGVLAVDADARSAAQGLLRRIRRGLR